MISEERLAKIHVLKCWPEYYKAVVDGTKSVEIRRNDRDYQVGDCLVLHEWNPATEQYSGEMFSVRVTHIVDKQPFVPIDYVAMSIKPWIERDTIEIRSLQTQQTSRTLDSDEFTFIIDAINPDWHDDWIDHAQQSSQYSQRPWRVLADFIRREGSVEHRALELEVEALRERLDNPNTCGNCPARAEHCGISTGHCSKKIREACEAQASAEVSEEPETAE